MTDDNGLRDQAGGGGGGGGADAILATRNSCKSTGDSIKATEQMYIHLYHFPKVAYLRSTNF